MKDLEQWQKDEYRRQQAVEKAVDAADRIIMEYSDGTVEETDHLTAMLARRFMEKTAMALQHKLRIREIMGKGKEDFRVFPIK